MIVLTDWMAARMIGLGWIQQLDHAKMPNVHAQPDRQPRRRRAGTRTASYSRRGRAA